MPKRIVPLSDQKIKKAKPQLKQVTLFDGGGLFLLVTPTGGKLWRFKYRFGDKGKLLSFGTYPEISIANARRKREDARKLLSNGIDPGEVRKAQKTASIAVTENSFEVVAREWHGKFTPRWTAVHADTTIRRLERDAFPWIGARPIGEIKAPEVLAVLRRVESRGALETAHRVKTICGQVFRYAVATGRAERDPAADLKGSLPPAKKHHLAALTDPKEVATLLRAIDSYQGSFVVKCALQLAAMFFVRPGELRHAEWNEFDFDAGTWSIPSGKMKMKQAHIVPLAQQAVEVLKALQPLTGNGQYVFPSNRSSSRPMSNNAILAALRRMGYDKDEMSGHGFRAMARTILDEVLQVRPEFIEHQPPKKSHLAAVTDPKDVADLLRAIDSYQGSFSVKCALQLAAMFFVRPGELRHAEWDEFDFDAATWSIPAGKMKMKQAHIVPLSQQAVEVLKSLQPLTGRGRYVFPSTRSSLRPMSNNAILAALRRMGYSKDEMTGHGFRAMARTILDEVLQVRPEFIEHQLAHAVRDPNGRAYNRTAHLEERKKMMQQWSDYLDGLKAGAAPGSCRGRITPVLDLHYVRMRNVRAISCLA